MGLIKNVLENGWYAGCIFTEAEREANRICKNIKTTIIDGDEDDENFDPYGFKITVRPTRNARILKYFGFEESDAQDTMYGRVKEAHSTIMDCLDRQGKKYAHSGQEMESGDDGDNV